jgi:S1-C subfamily serine protease
MSTPKVRRARPRITRHRARAAVLLVLAVVVGSSAAVALGAFSPDISATSTATGVFQLPQPWLGLTTKTATRVAGATVTRVTPGGPADQAGLQPGDVITAINGQPTTGPGAITTVVESQSVGAEVLLQVDRGGQLQTVGVIVAGRPGGSP